MKLFRNFALLLFMVIAPTSASASIYSPRTPDNHHWKQISPLGSQWHSHVQRARLYDVTAQDSKQCNCSDGQQAYGIGFIADTLNSVSGYWRFYNVSANGGGRFWVQTSQFSKKPYECAMGCYVGGEYRPPSGYHVQEIAIWADNTAKITYFQCEP